MIHTDPSSRQPATAQDREARAAAHEARRKAVFAENRDALFDALGRHGIERVTVIFDGYGDSGQIEDIAHAGGGASNLTAIHIALKVAVRGKDTVETVTVPLRTAIEDITYALLEQTHCGWQDNEGSSGEFVFDVAARRITLEINERFMSHETYHHQF